LLRWVILPPIAVGDAVDVQRRSLQGTQQPLLMADRSLLPKVLYSVEFRSQPLYLLILVKEDSMLKIISSILKNISFVHNSYENGSESFILTFMGIQIEVDSSANIHIKNINKLFLEYNYFFMGNNSNKSKEEICQEAILMTAQTEIAIAEERKKREKKLKEVFPFLENDAKDIPEFRLAESGLWELVEESKSCNCSPKKIKQTTFWVGNNKVTLLPDYLL
jgi:hypothetical protein